MAIEFIGDSVQYFGSTKVLVKTKKCTVECRFQTILSVAFEIACELLLRPLFYKIYTVSFPYDNSMAYYKNIVNI
jgi:hypothetical protein